MAKKQKLNPDLNPSSAEFSKLAKMSQKELGNQQSSGTFDEWDVQNITEALGRFEFENPGLINRMYNQVCTEIALSGIKKHAELAEGFRKGFWLPHSPDKKKFDIAKWMEQAYPGLWRDEKLARKFMRHFPQFSYEHAVKRNKR